MRGEVYITCSSSVRKQLIEVLAASSENAKPRIEVYELTSALGGSARCPLLLRTTLTLSRIKIFDMKITESLTHATAAGDAGNATTFAPGQQVLAGGYVTIIVIVTVVIFLVVGLAVYKTCTVTWVSFRTTGRRRHESGRWLTSDNPLMWDDEAPYGELNPFQCHGWRVDVWLSQLALFLDRSSFHSSMTYC